MRKYFKIVGSSFLLYYHIYFASRDGGILLLTFFTTQSLELPPRLLLLYHLNYDHVRSLPLCHLNFDNVPCHFVTWTPTMSLATLSLELLPCLLPLYHFKYDYVPCHFVTWTHTTLSAIWSTSLATLSPEPHPLY